MQQNISFSKYDKIKHYFDELNQDNTHFVNSNDICTPIDCVKEMVDSVPSDFWQQNIKVLDSCCGNGNFHAYINTKTKLSNLYFNEINPKRVKNLINYFGKNINLTTKDFLTFDDKEKYDMVVSNPPYAKFNDNKRVSKNHNLSRDFIQKALTITKRNGYILFVVPNNWMSFSDRNTLPQELSQYQFIHLDIGGAKKYFPQVGSSFTWFLLKKTPNKSSFIVKNHYNLIDTQKVKLKENSSFIPLYYSNVVQNILNKTIYNQNIKKYKIETTSYLHRYTKKDVISETKNNEFKYKLIHTPSKMVKRIQSYNCGKIEYRITGTNSTTNYFVLQGLLNIDEVVNVYVYFTEKPKYKVFGKTYQDGKQPAKTAENIIINDFIKNHNKKPIGCTQT
jgi:SAM-dependent methyltransferase